MHYGIIGAGLAGLTCAAALKAAGHAVMVIDKGRGPGGRMSARRADTPLGEVRFDHGAQYMSSRDPAFTAQLEAWEAASHVAPWQGRFVEIDENGVAKDAALRARRWVGVPAMNGVIRALAAPLHVHWATRAVAIGGEAGAWTLELEGADAPAGPFERIFLAIPAEQAAPLLAPVCRDFAAVAAACTSAPSWTAMFAFNAPLEMSYDAARIAGGPLGWVARNASKPARSAAETWVAQAAADWSREHLEDDAGTVSQHLERAFRALTGAPKPVHAGVHRWRFAQTEKPAGQAYQFSAELGLGTCGDWHLGGKCEHAFLSGSALAKAALTRPPA